MISIADVVGLLVILGVNSAAAALLTRFFRVRLNTRWGAALYAVLLGTLVLTVLTIVLGGVGLGPDLGNPAAVMGLTVVLPLATGIAFDYFWMPAPDDVDLPAEYRERSSRNRREL
ncbi:hypothetical protein [Haloglomus halophilum]|uniref:hypothetical protein n=1 Tax=Haloglomus halophilum TaxID=2962672 RepID=UPI0020CA072C|nr:hypothetical protein [Haloglomus halophilum]